MPGKSQFFINACALVMLGIGVPGQAAPKADKPASPLAGLRLDLPARKFVLSNGLTLIVHQDRSAPLVAVSIWYHVGSKNEPRGRSGFAHLFEHLMFNGSENYNDDFYKATQKLGATDQNGTTSEDRTNYFQTVPKGALDAMLWLESDRMGHLLGAVDQAKLDEQRAVVKNEKRQGENRPYAVASDLIVRAMVPPGHPYDHRVIGSMADLDAASLADVKDWFRSYYGPNNAVLVLAGDIDPEEAKAKVEKYFGDIPPGPPVAQLQSWPIRSKGTIRETAFDRVAEAVVYRLWNISDYGSADTDYLQLLGQVLAGDSNSRLYKRLVVNEQLANSVDVSVNNRESGGQFQIGVTVKSGVDSRRIEAVVDEELKRLAATGPTQAELDRVRTPLLASYVRSFQHLSGKADILAESQTYLGDPSGWKISYQRLVGATPADLRRAQGNWLSDGDYVLTIQPYGTPTAGTVAADRKTIPPVAPSAPAAFPAIEHATLSNGLKIALVRRAGVPLVDMTMIFDSGVAADYATIKAGTSGFALPLMTEGTVSRTGDQLTEALAALGASVTASADGENSYVGLSALKTVLEPALAIYADIITHPAFRQEDVERAKRQSVAMLASTRQNPSSTASRLALTAMYGAGSPYGQIPTEVSIGAITRQDLIAFHQRWFRPNNATLVVVGDTDLRQIVAIGERLFASWRAAPVPERIVPVAGPRPSPTIYLVDKPGAPQSVIRVATLAPPRIQGDDLARRLFNAAFGGTFTSRLNMKLREEKGWAYGASSGFSTGHGTRLFSAAASVQSDKTAESMSEIAKLLNDVTRGQPIDQKELANARDGMVLGLSSGWSTNAGVSGSIADQVANTLPADYYSNYVQRISAVTLEDVNRAAAMVLGDQQLTWVVVGDLSKIEPAVRALKFGDVRIVDPDGRPVPVKASQNPSN